MRLEQRVGDLSPMALMWTFMSYSRTYVHFAGIAELVGGALVLFRRSTALGAIVVLAVMTNVVLLDFCYDVPVKILSVHVWLMALLLLAPDLGRLADVLVLNRPTSPRSQLLQLPRRWMRIARMILKPVFIAAMVLTSAISMLQLKRSFLGGTPPSFEGVWDVEARVQTGGALPSLLLQVSRWRRVGFSYGRMAVDPMDDRLSVPLEAAFDESAQTITLTDEPRERCTLRYTRVDDEHVTLESGAGTAIVQLRLRKHHPEAMLLLTREFHWINESSFNR